MNTPMSGRDANTTLAQVDWAQLGRLTRALWHDIPWLNCPPEHREPLRLAKVLATENFMCDVNDRVKSERIYDDPGAPEVLKQPASALATQLRMDAKKHAERAADWLCSKEAEDHRTRILVRVSMKEELDFIDGCNLLAFFGPAYARSLRAAIEGTPTKTPTDLWEYDGPFVLLRALGGPAEELVPDNTVHAPAAVRDISAQLGGVLQVTRSAQNLGPDADWLWKDLYRTALRESPVEHACSRLEEIVDFYSGASAKGWGVAVRWHENA